MDWISVILLIAFGIILIVVELLFVPGTTLVGLIGLLCMGLAIYFAFSSLGRPQGWLVLGSTIVITTVAVIYSFRSNTWKRFTLKGKIDSRVNEDFKHGLSVGDQGTALSALRPMGKAEFKEVEVEVSTLGNYVESRQAIKIIQIESNKIIVEPLNQ